MACSGEEDVMLPNWFVGLKIPAGDWHGERVMDPPEGFRRFTGDDLHLTVAFLGAVGEDAAYAAWTQRRGWRKGALLVELGEVVPMGNPGRYSALSLILGKGRGEVTALMDFHRAGMFAAAGARPDTRPPLPHVTVARPRQRASREERRRGIAWADSQDCRGVELTIAEIALYTWSEDRTRSLFRVVASGLVSDPGS
jgi:2'-5' RNA ligase